MPSRSSGPVWISLAFATAVVMAAGALSYFGVGRIGIEAALRVTARLAFVLFWPSYVGGALATLFGPVFRPVKLASREFGLAFAGALAAHLGLVGWLCWIGAPPAVRTFLVFGPGVAWTAALALVSIERLGKRMGRKGWWLLRNVGMNYLAFLFILDFVRLQPFETIIHLAEYLPFATLAVLGPALRLLAWLKPVLRPKLAGTP
jgi:hypothetical protein